jgi:hypothetical protein
MRRLLAGLALGLALAVGAACDGDDDGNGMGPEGPFTLTFQLDASFQTPHGGQTIQVAVVEAASGSVVERDDGTVSSSADPAFSFTTGDVLEDNTAYEVHYWIDSNFGGGAVDVCDAIEVDHQWNVAVPAPSDDVTITESHDPQATEDVCSSFEFDLTFAGDAGFQAAHGGQDIYVAVGAFISDASPDVTVIARADGTVSGSDDPAFSFSFPGVLAAGVDREVRYWIDSNFGGGTFGVCDQPENDHQWKVMVSGSTGDVTVTEMHDPAEVSLVCESFIADLSFSGDASFQGAHGGQNIHVSLVRASDGAVVASGTDVVSANDDPSFSMVFPAIPVIGVAYEIQYWIDSNFGGGTADACDAPEIDHQWIVPVPTVEGNVDITDTHRPGDVEDVCGTSMPVSFAGDIQPVFTANCALSGCHGDTNTQPVGKPMLLVSGQAYDNIVDVAAFELASMDRIEPGQPDNSYLVHKIQGTQLDVGGSGDQMPLGQTPLPQEVIDLIRRWITEGAEEN